MTKTPKFPQPIEFERIKAPKGSGPHRMLGGRCFYTYVGFRPPLKGEWYLSGAIVQAWRAPNDLATAYHIVQPTHYAKLVKLWRHGLAVEAQ